MGTYQESEKQLDESQLTLVEPVCRHCSVRTAAILCPTQSPELQVSTIVILISLVEKKNRDLSRGQEEGKANGKSKGLGFCIYIFEAHPYCCPW